MDELEEIKKRKFEDLKNTQLDQMQQQTQEEEQLKQQIQQLEKQALTKDALLRYGNLKAAFPDRAVQLLVILAQAIQSGQIKNIDDNTLKEILKKISPNKKDIKIKRV